MIRTLRLTALAVLLVSPLEAQKTKPFVIPHYPTATEKLPATLPHDAFHPVALTGEQFITDSRIGNPDGLAVNGDVLWVSDRVGSPFLHAVDLATGTIRKSLGPKGQGPGDFMSVRSLNIRPGDAQGIWAYDVMNMRMTRVTAAAEGKQPQRAIPALGIIPREGMYVAQRMLWLTRERILFIGLSDTNRIMLADSLGHVLTKVASPLLGHAGITKHVREIGSQSVAVCARPQGDVFAMAYGSASRIDLFDGTGKRLVGAKVPIPNRDEGDFAQDAKGVWHHPRPRVYYRSCSATRDRLYVLFSGRLEPSGEPLAIDRYNGQFVHVFDWTGKLLSVLKLDGLAAAITVSGDTLLFAGGEDMDGIFRYRLPRLGSRGQ